MGREVWGNCSSKDWVCSLCHSADFVNMGATDYDRALEGKRSQLFFKDLVCKTQQVILSVLQSDCLGRAVLLCLVVCLTLLASFFLPSHLS